MQEKIENIKNWLYSKKYYFFIILLMILGIGFYIYGSDNKKNELNSIEYENSKTVLVDDVKDVVSDNVEPKEEIVEKCFVKVDIKGYVNKPGLYEMECDNRIQDVINKAGGLKKNADTSVINLSKKVFDQMVIIIYSSTEVKNFNKVLEDTKEKEEKCLKDKAVVNDACISTNLEEEKINKETSVQKNTNSVNSDSSKEKVSISLNKASKEELMTLTGIGESKAIAIIKYREENCGFNNIEEIMNISGIGEKLFDKIKANITL